MMKTLFETTATPGFYLIVLLALPIDYTAAQDPGKQRNILMKEFQQLALEKDLITDHSWIEIPDYYDRNFWTNLPEPVREAYISAAENYGDYGWPGVKATD